MKDNKLTKVDALDKEGVETLLAYMQSKTVEEAAQTLGITRQGLWLRVKKYKLDEIVSEVPKEALMRLQVGSTKAADVLVGELDERQNKMEAAKEILDRVGLTGDKDGSVNIENKVLVIPSELVQKYAITSDTTTGRA